MSVVRLRGYDVNFPYPVPYDIQKDYMTKVLTCLDEKSHAVLESPTGTGKTLCLFAPVTAWAKRHKSQAVVPHVSSESHKEISDHQFDNKEQQGQWGIKTKSKVWYTARTHSQIAQTVGEVRKCNIEGLHVRVMGARDQLCINEHVLEEKDSYVKTVKCKELVKAKKCKYYTKLTHEKDFRRFYQSGDILDIEDLVSLGRSSRICPYFLAKKASETADIVLLPYNYIIDRESRESNGFYLQNDVIIFDEGHNVPSTCEESYEFSFTSLDVAIGIKNVQEVMLGLSKLADEVIDEEEIDLAKHASNSVMMMEILKNLELALAQWKPSNDLLPVTKLYNFMSSAGINETKSRELVEGIASFKSDSAKLSLSGSTLETFNLLEKMMNTVFGPTVRSFEKSIIDKSFKCVVTVDPERQNVKKFSLFCFNPSFGIKSLLMLGSQSIIITSGTLSPLRTFISELALPKPITLENRHIAKKCQVPFIILATGVNNVKMDATFRNRSDEKYVISLGMSLTNLIASVPDGVLLLFSSYTMMQNLKESWESDLGIWARLNALKRVFVEPRNKEEFINCMENYKRAIDSGNGAILMGVLRGKISEGMDFKDQYCRGVFIIGVPFPPIQDPRVIGKQKYSESLTVYNPSTKAEEKLYNQPFSSIEAMKATNQAIGRVIRHGKDYGVIFLVDYRFAWPRLFYNVSSWLRGDAPVESNFPTAKKLVSEFFRNIHSGNLGVEEVRCQPVDANGCPIASYKAYEEYDHKKQTRQPKQWIGPDPVEPASTSQSQRRRETDKRGHARIEYQDDDDLNPENLLSKYSAAKFQSWLPSKKSTPSDSLLEAIEKEGSTCNKRRNSGIESNKRKYDEDDGDGGEGEKSKCKNSFPKLSPSLFSPPESSPSGQSKKYAHLKVRPFLPSAEGDSDVSAGSPAENCRREKTKADTEEEVKVKLIEYYRRVKRSLSPDDEKKFKQISCKYMKSEAKLSEVITVMDQVFSRDENKNLFLGFGVCVKSKDSSEWTSACERRGINPG